VPANEPVLELRRLKCEEVYLHADDTVAEARAGIAGWITSCNVERITRRSASEPLAKFSATGRRLWIRSTSLPACPHLQRFNNSSYSIQQGKTG